MGKAVPAALQMLSDARSSCLMTVTAEGGTATLSISKGNILWATSNKSQRLGDALVEKGFVDRETLESVLSMQKRKRTRDPVCQILCQLGLVSEEVAHAEIAAQTLDVLLDVLTWEQGSLRVEPVAASETEAGQPVEPLLVRAALIINGVGSAEVTGDGAIAVE